MPKELSSCPVYSVPFQSLAGMFLMYSMQNYFLRMLGKIKFPYSIIPYTTEFPYSGYPLYYWKW